jgi:hypothetical protein
MALVRIEPPGESTQTAFFIRDTSATVRGFGRTPGIAGRYRGLDWRKQVMVVVLVLKVRTKQEPVYYDLWLNLRESEISTVPFVDLAVQSNLTFQFFGDDGGTMTACMIKNPFREFARTLLRELERYPTWDSEQYRQAEAELRAKSPTLKDLWEALGRSSPPSPRIKPVPL